MVTGAERISVLSQLRVVCPFSGLEKRRVRKLWSKLLTLLICPAGAYHVP